MSLKPPVTSQDHSQGSSTAKLELVEYGDYQCPHCGRAYPVIKQVQEALGDHLRFVFRNFPLAEIHPQATLAAVATEAAAKQGKYWEMHDIIFENQDSLERKDLIGYAKQLELDTEQFEADLDSGDLLEVVEDDFESGVRSGVNGTPAFFINGHKYNGSWEPDQLISALSAYLPKAGA